MADPGTEFFTSKLIFMAMKTCGQVKGKCAGSGHGPWEHSEFFFFTMLKSLF